ncbi:MAG: ATP-binding cassette domain-containing protein [Ignavibacteria bacterium]|jgi:phospholipid/cholesterol/gamma-HCH transport system ATP-binding protein
MGNNVEEIIRFENVSIGFNGREILKDISFSVKKGDTLVILGPSGAGKSSILKVMLGLWKPDKGKIYIYGKDIVKLNESELLPLRRKMGIVFQGNALFDSLTVEENIGYFLKERNSSTEKQILERVKECLSFVNLDNVESLYPSELSGGMKKRVAIARAVAFKPEIIFYDEPTTGIDPINSRAIIELMQKIKNDGATSIVVTHYVHDAVQVGNNFAVIDSGVIIHKGILEEILKSDNKFIMDFFAELNNKVNPVNKNICIN